jgi:hypothetical protein
MSFNTVSIVLLEIGDKVSEPFMLAPISLTLSIIGVFIGLKRWWFFLFLLPAFALPNVINIYELLVYKERSDFAVMGLNYTILTFTSWNLPFLVSGMVLMSIWIINTRERNTTDPKKA